MQETLKQLTASRIHLSEVLTGCGIFEGGAVQKRKGSEGAAFQVRGWCGKEGAGGVSKRRKILLRGGEAHWSGKKNTNAHNWANLGGSHPKPE